MTLTHLLSGRGAALLRPGFGHPRLPCPANHLVVLSNAEGPHPGPPKRIVTPPTPANENVILGAQRASGDLRCINRHASTQLQTHAR